MLPIPNLHPKMSIKIQKFRLRNMKRYPLWNLSYITRDAVKRANTNSYDAIKRKLKNALVGCDVHFFGSRVMGLSLKKSDLDIFIDMSKNKETVSYQNIVKIANNNYISQRSILLSSKFQGGMC